MRLPIRALLAAAVLALAGCSSISRFLDAYTIDIQQGNYVSQEMVSRLRPGMSKEQVRFVMGTPLLTDVFHVNRWDYVYYDRKPGAKPVERKVAVFFKDGKLDHLEGDVVTAGEQREFGENGK